jgi:hypothetical protein
MTAIAGDADIAVTRHLLVLLVGIGLIVLMAVNAFERAIVVRDQMAISANAPCPLVMTRKDGKILTIMVECRWRPGDCVMTQYTLSGESQRNVIGISSSIKV